MREGQRWRRRRRPAGNARRGRGCLGHTPAQRTPPPTHLTYSCRPVSARASSTRWHQGQGLPTYLRAQRGRGAALCGRLLARTAPGLRRRRHLADIAQVCTHPVTPRDAQMVPARLQRELWAAQLPHKGVGGARVLPILGLQGGGTGGEGPACVGRERRRGARAAAGRHGGARRHAGRHRRCACVEWACPGAPNPPPPPACGASSVISVCHAVRQPSLAVLTSRPCGTSAPVHSSTPRPRLAASGPEQALVDSSGEGGQRRLHECTLLRARRRWRRLPRRQPLHPPDPSAPMDQRTGSARTHDAASYRPPAAPARRRRAPRPTAACKGSGTHDG